MPLRLWNDQCDNEFHWFLAQHRDLKYTYTYTYTRSKVLLQVRVPHSLIPLNNLFVFGWGDLAIMLIRYTSFLQFLFWFQSEKERGSQQPRSRCTVFKSPQVLYDVLHC